MRKTDPFNLLRLVYTNGPLSRTDIAERVEVAPSYVSGIVSQALQRGLVLEQGFVPSKGGRRRILLGINPGLAQMIGIDFGRRNIRIVVADFAGKILDYRPFGWEASKGRDHVLQLVDTVLKDLLPKYPAIAAIGIAHSGVISRQEGKVLFFPQVSGWEETPIKQMFEKQYGFPTVVEDAVRAMATMEHRFGYGKDRRNFVYMSVGMGIGSAIFVDGRLYAGNDGLAGELGHVTVREDGGLCSCGNRGCLELYASGSAIIEMVREALRQGVTSSLTDEVGSKLDELSVEQIATAAQSHDRLAERILSEAGSYLGAALATVVNLLNPERIILSGKVPRATEKILLDSLLYNLRHRALPQSTKDLDVIVSQFGDDAAAVGAVLLAGEEVLESRCREMEWKLPPSVRQSQD